MIQDLTKNDGFVSFKRAAEGRRMETQRMSKHALRQKTTKQVILHALYFSTNSPYELWDDDDDDDDDHRLGTVLTEMVFDENK